MARTLEQIKYIIVSEKQASPALAELTSTSKAAVWNEWANNIAYAHFVLEQSFDQHKAEITTMIANQKKGSALWYRNMALAFQYGFDLIADTDRFKNDGHAEDEISASKIVKYSAVTEAETESRLIVKIATETNGELQPITKPQLEGFTAYMEEVKYAGVQVSVINYLPDILRLEMLIYRDPLVIDANGTSILTGKRPVEEAIKEYMKELPFNGELVLAHLVDKLQKVEGVRIPHIVSAQSKWIDANSQNYGTWDRLTVKRLPVSGYFKMENFERIKYVV